MYIYVYIYIYIYIYIYGERERERWARGEERKDREKGESCYCKATTIHDVLYVSVSDFKDRHIRRSHFTPSVYAIKTVDSNWEVLAPARPYVLGFIISSRTFLAALCKWSTQG